MNGFIIGALIEVGRKLAGWLLGWLSEVEVNKWVIVWVSVSSGLVVYITKNYIFQWFPFPLFLRQVFWGVYSLRTLLWLAENWRSVPKGSVDF